MTGLLRETLPTNGLVLLFW